MKKTRPKLLCSKYFHDILNVSYVFTLHAYERYKCRSVMSLHLDTEELSLVPGEYTSTCILREKKWTVEKWRKGNSILLAIH